MSEINTTPAGDPDFDGTAVDGPGLDDARSDEVVGSAEVEEFEFDSAESEDGTLDLRAVDMSLTAADAAALGLTAVLSLMRPDDVAPGPGRVAYRLAYGALSGATLWLSSPVEESAELDAYAARNVTTGIALGGGVLSAALFDARIGANWWADDLLARLGIRHPRVAVAGITVAATAVMTALERKLNARTAGFGFASGPDEEIEVELTPSQRAVLELLVVGESANARSLRDQLAAARFFMSGDHNYYRVEVPHDGPRILPHSHLHPVRGRFADADGVPTLVSLRIEDGFLDAVEVEPDWIGMSEDIDDWEPYATADSWPKPAAIEIVRDER